MDGKTVGGTGGTGEAGPGRLWAARSSRLGLAEAGRSAAGPSRHLAGRVKELCVQGAVGSLRGSRQDRVRLRL